MAASRSSSLFYPRDRQEPKLPPPSFYRAVYAEIEEVGWEHLLRAEEDLSCVSFRVLDNKGRIHILEISLSRDYPESSPTIAAEVPCICEVEWCKNSRLIDVVQQFSEHLQNMQEFWSTMDEIDRTLYVVNPTKSSLAASHRQIELGNDCSLLLHISPLRPRSLPECRFFGPDLPVDSMRNNWKKNSVKWYTQFQQFICNRKVTTLSSKIWQLFWRGNYPALLLVVKMTHQLIAEFVTLNTLPIDDELGDKSGSAPDYTCENTSCSKPFHSVCLRDWLHSITTTRRSFDVLFGDCPYCSEPIAVKVN